MSVNTGGADQVNIEMLEAEIARLELKNKVTSRVLKGHKAEIARLDAVIERLGRMKDFDVDYMGDDPVLFLEACEDARIQYARDNRSKSE